jgi:hypothetical protein
MGLLVAGTKYRGEFEERLKKLMEEIKQNDDIILVRLLWLQGDLLLHIIVMNLFCPVCCGTSGQSLPIERVVKPVIQVLDFPLLLADD